MITGLPRHTAPVVGASTDYAVFGGCLRSMVTLPELRPLSGGLPRWSLEVAADQPHESHGEVLGVELLDAGAALRLRECASGARLEYDDTGTFDILNGGAHIVWHPPNGDVPMASVRADILGRVLATALHVEGVVCFHGSAVEMHGAGVAFLAPKHHGKSTLALALVTAGARLLTDDTLPMLGGPTPLIAPGVQHVRLWEDAARHVSPLGLEADLTGEKHVIADLPAASLAQGNVPLTAVYVLGASAPPNGPAARRTLLSPAHATLALVRHAKLGRLLGRRLGETVLPAAAAIVRTRPVYLLELVRDFERLPEVIATVQGWHESSARPAVVEGR